MKRVWVNLYGRPLRRFALQKWLRIATEATLFKRLTQVDSGRESIGVSHM